MAKIRRYFVYSLRKQVMCERLSYS
ncbi:hypothetical protein PUN4_310072 [Paraburkholderia unamae]|nr:hypothetical protein PUN4_310072 [Paraburkholderia unamae]